MVSIELVRFNMKKNLKLHLKFVISSFRIYLDDLKDLTNYQSLQFNIYYFLKQVSKTLLKSNLQLQLFFVILRSKYQSQDIMLKSYLDEYVQVDDYQELHELVCEFLIIFVFQELFLSKFHQEFSQPHHQLNNLSLQSYHFILLNLFCQFHLLLFLLY